MVLIAGSTGTLGGLICQILAEKKVAIRALVRSSSNKETVKSLAKLGAEVVEGDFRDSASLARACAGVQTVISTVSAMPTRYTPGDNDIAAVDLRGTKALIDAARAAGVERFVYVSFSLDNRCPLRDAKRDVERHLMASGMTYTVLQPSAFMETWLGPLVGFDYAKASVRIYGTGDKPISYISVRDVAAFATAALETTAAANALVPLGGPEAISPNAAVKIFEQIAGRPFTVERVPVEALTQQQKEATDPMQKSFATLMLNMAAGDAISMATTARDFGIRLRSVRQYAEEALPQAVRA